MFIREPKSLFVVYYQDQNNLSYVRTVGVFATEKKANRCADNCNGDKFPKEHWVDEVDWFDLEVE